MKKFSSVALLLVTIALVVAVLVWQLPSLDADTENPAAGDGSPATSASPGSTAPNSTAPDRATLALPADAIRSRVTFVHDGDTLYLQPAGTSTRAEEIKVRLIGIDTPELRPTVECFGIEARDHLRALVPQGASVWVKPDVEEFDQYGRSLLYVWTDDGRSVNLDLVKNGYATALSIAPSNTFRTQFDLAEREAQSARAGLWRSC